MRVYQPFQYITHTGHRLRVQPGEYDCLPADALAEARRQGALEAPIAKAHQSAPMNKGRKRARA